MKRLLLGTAATALVLLVAGCGDSTSDATHDPGHPTSSATASPTETPSSPPTESDGAVEFQEIAILSQTAAGGEVDPNAVRLDEQDARETFLGQFEQPAFGSRIDDTIAGATIPEGYALIGAVISIGCDVPPGVFVTGSPDGWVITPQKVASPLLECFAPVTTVALVAVPA